MIRLCGALAVIAVALVAGCRDRLPTDSAIQVHAPAAHICFTDRSGPLSCACNQYMYDHPDGPPSQLCFLDSAQVVLSSDHGPRPSISVNSGDTVMFGVYTDSASTVLSVTGYSFVPLPPIAMARRIPGRGGVLPAIRAAPARVGSAASVTRGRSAIFAPGRSAQLLPGVTSCRTATDSTCFDVFTTSGYEIVSATVDGVAERDSILVTVVVPSRLALTCTPADPLNPGKAKLVRADSVTCKASVTPAGATDELVITDWDFVSSDTSFALSRRGAGLPFGPDSTQWSGTMVMSGKVTVTGTVGGVADSASAAITVTARDWSKDTVAYQIIPGPSRYGDPPANVHKLGENNEIGSVSVDSLKIIGFGPNTGLAYFTAIPFRLAFNVSYNTSTMRVGSTFYSMQPFVNTVFRGVPYCGRFHVTADTVGVKAHEGFRATDVNSHTDSFKAAFLAFVRIPAEGLVGPAVGPALARKDSVLLHKAFDAANARSAFVTDTASNPYSSNCVFNYDPKLRIP